MAAREVLLVDIEIGKTIPGHLKVKQVRTERPMVKQGARIMQGELKIETSGLS